MVLICVNNTTIFFSENHSLGCSDFSYVNVTLDGGQEGAEQGRDGPV